MTAPLQSPSYNSDNFTPDGTSQTQGSPVTYGTSTSDPSSNRLAASGLATGATNTLKDIAGRVFNFDFVGANGSPLPPEGDWRVRISMAPSTSNYFYSLDNPITRWLVPTKGVIFPYTPSITMSHKARYGTAPLTHANYASFFYEGSEVNEISITADFTVQNTEEGCYLAAVIHFFRSCTKMFYGASGLAGTPPPMVFLDGYGASYLPHVPCVVTTFSHTMPSDVDYVAIPVGAAISSQAGSVVDTSNFSARTRLPTSSQITVGLQPIYSRNNIANNFTLEAFARGYLLKGSSDNVGGFL